MDAKKLAITALKILFFPLLFMVNPKIYVTDEPAADDRNQDRGQKPAQGPASPN